MKILLAGEGGQGVQLTGELLAKAAFLESKSALLIPNFGVEQRGGVSLAFVVIDKDPVVYPKFEKADLLVIFCDRAIERVNRYADQQTKIVFGPAVTVKPARKTDLPSQVWNIFLLGELVHQMKIVDLENVKKAMEERLGERFAKNPKLRDLDYQALGV